MCASNDRSIVAAGDVDCNQLVGAISRRDGDAIRVGDTFNKLIVWGVGGVGPGPISMDAEFAITVAAFDCSLDNEGIGAIHIGC